MKRIITSSGLLVVFSFLFSTYAYGLMLTTDDTSGVMPVAKRGLTLFAQKGSDPFWIQVARGEPVLFLSQQNPPLDISGIKIIQAIPVGEVEVYRLNTTKGISMRTILDSIANLAVMQFDVENFTVTIKNSDGIEETIIGGEFGRILRKEILGFNPISERSVLVKHTEFVQTPGLTPKFDEDKFKLDINGREIELKLVRDFGRPDKGFPEWGVRYMLLKQYVPNSGNPPKTEERSLSIDLDEAFYTIRILAPDGKLLSWEKWEFLPGNPNPVNHWKG